MDGPHRALVLVLLLAGPAGLAPQASAAQGAPGETADPATEARILLFPVDDPYVESLAGPHRRGFGITYADLRATDLADTGDRLFGLLVGGRFGLFRVRPAGRPDRGLQLGIEAGFYGQFDVDRSYDNLGWDGFYGLALTAALGGGWAAKLGILHTSSHVGDEYAERTGRRRIGYTREELVVGVSRSIGERWRAWAEAGWGYDLRNEALQEAGRLRASLEYLAPGALRARDIGWYWAADASAAAERDGQLDWAVDLGLLLSPFPRRWRLGLQLYDGRAPLGEFFQHDQRTVSLGLWLDL